MAKICFEFTRHVTKWLQNVRKRIDRNICIFRQCRSVPLEPFVHQVGGHFPMACLATDIVCKPLNEREHKFYKSMAKSLLPFVPRYEGTMKVEVHEDNDG